MGEPQGRPKWYTRFLNSMLCASNDPEAPQKTWKTKCIDCMKPNSEDAPDPNESEPKRETWGNRCTFFMSTLGMSVGLGQVWRFPTLAYAQGGGAFLIIYGVMIFLFGNALFFFEISNGQYSSKNPLKVYDKVPLFVGLGWAMIAYSYLFCTYYNHMVGFGIYYFYHSFTANMPWTYCQDPDFPDSVLCVPYPKKRNPEFDGVICGTTALVYNRSKLCSDKTYAKKEQTDCCNAGDIKSGDCESYFNVTLLCSPREYPSNYFWNHNVNRVYREGDPKFGYLGPINLHLLVCSFLSWFIAFAVLYKGLKSLGLLMYIMVPLPYIVLCIMLGIAVTQNGAGFGLKKFFIPRLKSFIDITVWRIATEQAFYSIGVAMGPLVTFGSYSRFNSPSHIDGVLICLCIFLTSVLCSLVVFSVLGFLSIKTGRPFENVVEVGPGLVFVVYPESLELLPGSQFFSALFYLMLINLGLSSVTGIIETVSSAIYDIWPRTRNFKYLVNLVVLGSCFFLGMPITTRGGLTVYYAFDAFSAGLPLMPICAAEMFIIVYIYGIGRFCEDISFMIGFYPNRYYRYQWLLGPFILLAVFIYGLVTLRLPVLKLWALLTGWTLFMAVVGWVLAGMIYTLVTFKRRNMLKDILKAPPEHGPKKQSDREARLEYSVKRKIF